MFYLDPKVAVGTIIANDRHEVVLVRRAIEPGYGKWVYPGGYVDRGEEVLSAAIRSRPVPFSRRRFFSGAVSGACRSRSTQGRYNRASGGSGIRDRG